MFDSGRYSERRKYGEKKRNYWVWLIGFSSGDVNDDDDNGAIVKVVDGGLLDSFLPWRQEREEVCVLSHTLCLSVSLQIQNPTFRDRGDVLPTILVADREHQI